MYLPAELINTLTRTSRETDPLQLNSSPRIAVARSAPLEFAAILKPHLYHDGLSRDDYVSQSGGVTRKADKKQIYVVHANGSVIANSSSRWYSLGASAKIETGDTIVVPLDTERVRALPVWQSVSTIIYNLAIALLAIRSF